MADKYEKNVRKFLDQQRITEEEAKNAASFGEQASERAQSAQRAGIRLANSNFEQVGTNAPYKKNAEVTSKYSYISEDVAKKIVNGRRKSTSHDIWRQVNSPNWMSGNVQRAVQDAINIQNGDVLLGLDIETLGTAKFQGGAGNFGVTQIAAVPYKVDFSNADGPLVRMPGEPVNVLTKPNESTMKWLRSTLNKLKTSKGVVPNLTAEEYRSLKDLIAYAGDAQFGDAAGVILKTNSMALSDGVNLKRYIGLIEKGLDNLENKALSITEAMDTLNRKMFNGGFKIGENFKYFTFNGLAFDLPALNEATGGKLPLGQGHLDMYEASKQAYGDLYSAFYKDRSTSSVRSIGKLENVFQATFGMSMQEAGLKAHYGVDDVTGMGMVGNKKLNDIIGRIKAGARTGGHDIMGRYNGSMSASVQYQMDTMTNGMTLFARGSAFKGSNIDTVIDMNNPKGRVRKVGPAIYKNRTYQIVDQFMQNGHYSVLLHNQEDDVYHLVGRESKEELQSLMQRSFVPYDPKMPGLASIRNYSVYDAARREYEGMFVGQGAHWKATKYMEVVDKMEKAAGGKALNRLSLKEVDALLANNDFGLTTTQQRHMRQFYKRLGAEAPTIKDFLGAIKKAGIKAGDQKDLAMENFKEALTAEVGNPTRDLKLPSRMAQTDLFVPGPKGGARRGVDATRFDTLEAGIRSILTGGVKESNMNFANVVDNFNQVVSDLVGQGVIGMDEGKKLLYDSSRFLANKGDKTSGAMYLSQLLTNNIGDKLARVNSIQGVADLKATSHIVHGLKDPSSLFSGAIDSAKNMIVYSNKGLALTADAKNFIDSFHSEKVMAMQKALKLPGTKMPNSITQELEAFANSLADQDIFMSVYVDKKQGRGLKLALYNKEHAAEVMRQGLKSKHIAQAYIPLAENDMMIAGGVNKANIMYAVMGNNGNTWMSTTEHQVMFKLKYTKDRIVDALKTGNVDAATRVMNKAVYNAINPLSSMSRFADVESQLDFSSKAANWLRTSYVNVSPLIDKVLDGHNLSFDKLTLDQSNDLIRDILHGKDGTYRTKYGKEIQDALGGLHLNLGVSSVKTELMNKGIFATADARWLVPLGTYSPATRESIRQAQNYYSLDPSKVNSKMINPVIMTDTAAEVYGGEVTGLMVKTARMNDTAIKQLIGDKWDGINLGAQPSTYEQMGLVKQSVAEQFGTFKRKRVYVDPGTGLEVNPAVMRALDNGGFASFEGRITLGQVIKDNDGKPIGGAANPVQYESKYGAVLKGVSLEDSGRYAFDIDEFVPSTRGTKFMTESGLKFTQRIIPDAAWNEAFQGFDDVGLIVAGEIYKSNKQPAAMHILPELQYAVDEYLAQNVTAKDVTVRMMERQKAESRVVDVIGNMLGSKNGIRFEDYYMAGGSTQRVLMLPGQSGFKDISWTAVDDAVKSLGVNTSRMIGGYDANIGLNLVRKVMVEEYPEFIGAKKAGLSKFEGVNWGLRELEMIRTRHMRYNMSGSGTDISALYDNMKSKMLNITAENVKENKGIFGIIQQSMMNTLEGDYATLSLDDVDNINRAPFRMNGNYLDDFRGTILDSSISGGKAGVMVQLPEKFKMGNGYIDQIYMPHFNLNNKVVGGVVQPNGLQRKQLGLIEAIQDYRSNITSGQTDIAERAHSRIQTLLNDYVLEAGAQGFGSRGQVARGTLSNSMKHSGRTIASAYGIADYFDEAGNVIRDEIVRREGHVGISEKAVKTMFSGVGEADIRRILELSGQDVSGVAKGRTNAMDALLDMMRNPNGPGLPGLIGRNPTIGQGSVMAVKYFVDPKASRNSMLTVGIATILNADNDGDYITHDMAYLGGRKAKQLNEEAFKATQAMYDADIEMVRNVAEQTLNKAGKDLRSEKQLSPAQIAKAARENGIDDSIISHFGNPMTEMLEMESRLLKSVGQYSNLSLALRRSAETLRDGNVNVTVGKYQMYEILGAFGEQIEQKPISSKKLEELLDKAGVGADEKTLRLNQYVEAQRRLRTTDIYNMDVDAIINDAKAVGILDDAGITGHYGTMLRDKLGGDIGVEEVRSALTDVRNVFNKRGLQDPALRIFSSSPQDLQTVYDMYGAAFDEKRVIPSPNIRLLHEAVGGSLDEAQAANNLGKRILSGTKTAGGTFNEIPVSAVVGEVEETVGKNNIDNIMSGIGKAFGGMKVGGAAALGAAALGAWALSGMARSGPRTEHQPAEGYEDQAPSSDGTYVNPMKYAAGAPAGAGPSTAYVSPRGTGYERVNVRINGNINSGMTNSDIAQLVSDEVRRQAGIDLNLKITSQDNRQTIDKQWLQTQFANALKTGYVY